MVTVDFAGLTDITGVGVFQLTETAGLRRLSTYRDYRQRCVRLAGLSKLNPNPTYGVLSS